MTSVYSDDYDGPPSPKRPRLTKSIWNEEEEEDEEDTFDPENFYSSAASKLAEPVHKFVQSSLKRCIPKQKRQELAEDYPRPNIPAAKVPKLDPDITGALADELKKGEDKQLMKIQASVLTSASPLANFWSHLAEQGFEGKEDEYVQVSEVMDVIKSSLMLIGNASHYITQTRRKSIIEATKKSRPKLANFLQDICKEDLGDTGEDLFGPLARKKIVERANTIEAFNKALSKVDPPSKKSDNQQGGGGRFLSKGSGVSYGGGSSRIATPYHRKGHNKPNQGKGFKPKNSWSGNRSASKKNQ